MEYDRNLFGEIDQLVEIEVEGRLYQVPDKLEMLRVFQFLEFDIDYSRLCWNASCQRCFITYEKKDKAIKALACRTKSYDGMKLTRLPSTIRDTQGKTDPEDEVPKGDRD